MLKDHIMSYFFYFYQFIRNREIKKRRIDAKSICWCSASCYSQNKIKPGDHLIIRWYWPANSKYYYKLGSFLWILGVLVSPWVFCLFWWFCLFFCCYFLLKFWGFNGIFFLFCSCCFSVWVLFVGFALSKYFLHLHRYFRVLFSPNIKYKRNCVSVKDWRRETKKKKGKSCGSK